jgi:hypothetical protein
MPDATTYGMNNGARAGNGNGNANGNGNGHAAAPARNADNWNCTDGQKGFILRIVSESKLNKQDVEDMAQQLFGAGVRDLDKLQASQLIEDLLEKTGKKNGSGQRRWSRQPART